MEKRKKNLSTGFLGEKKHFPAYLTLPSLQVMSPRERRYKQLSSYRNEVLKVG